MKKIKKSDWMNQLRQVKDIVYKRNSSDKKNYNYVFNHKTFSQDVLELRKRYPNDQDFGSAVDKLIKKQFNPPPFPGVQNL
tara:strand:- start:504 stop:746 length:243 start_codon:yes stop_codon:yes gene_type:complete